MFLSLFHVIALIMIVLLQRIHTLLMYRCMSFKGIHSYYFGFEVRNLFTSNTCEGSPSNTVQICWFCWDVDYYYYTTYNYTIHGQLQQNSKYSLISNAILLLLIK